MNAAIFVQVRLCLVKYTSYYYYYYYYTDHKPLTFALSKAAEPWTPRQCRHLSYVAEFTSDIRHIAGQDNVVWQTPCLARHR